VILHSLGGRLRRLRRSVKISGVRFTKKCAARPFISDNVNILNCGLENQCT
jgi:hypothetical protein